MTWIIGALAFIGFFKEIEDHHFLNKEKEKKKKIEDLQKEGLTEREALIAVGDNPDHDYRFSAYIEDKAYQLKLRREAHKS